MKSLVKSLSVVFMLVLIGTTSSVYGQRLSATLNVGQLNLDKVDSEVADIDYQGSSAVSLNLRLFTKNKWAFRFGAGVDRLNYTVTGGRIATDYEAKRKDAKGILGVEKHFQLGRAIDIYPGVFVPITITGTDLIDANLDNIRNGDLRAGLGVVLGGNISLLKILRLGVEFDATYDNFKNQVWESAETLSFAPIKGIQVNTSFTVGVAF